MHANLCSLSDGTSFGRFSGCTAEGLTGGTALTSYPMDNITQPAGTCAVDRDCNVAGGEFCDKSQTTSSCACAASTGQDSCTALGVCRLTPCSRCQRCVSRMQSAVRTQLLSSGARKPSQVQITGAFNDMCEAYSYVAGYSRNDVCQFVIQTYIMPTGSSGYFGLRPGAVCSSLGECSALPADCKLTVAPVPATPLANVTGGLDMCSAEGIVGGSPLLGVVTVAGKQLQMIDITAPLYTAPMMHCTVRLFARKH